MLNPHSLGAPPRMHVRRCFCALILAMVLPGFAIAQPVGPVSDDASCTAEKADIEKRMEVARSKGQMLQRRQLADQLAALQATCKPLSPDQNRAANMERLEKEVRALRAELEAAEEQLRKLKDEGSR